MRKSERFPGRIKILCFGNELVDCNHFAGDSNDGGRLRSTKSLSSSLVEYSRYIQRTNT